MIALLIVSFTAAVVNGALGYGFSSIAVPLALLVVGSRALNPALVLLELALNVAVVWSSRAVLPRVGRSALVVLLGLAPGVVLGALALARMHDGWLRLGTFAVLLPLVVLQAAGVRRTRRASAPATLAFGAGLGTLYAATTISGPPLSIFLGGQGYAKQEFRALMGAIRLGASLIAAASYASAGIVSHDATTVLAYMLPGVVAGIPVGARVVRRVREETFRRASLGFDALVIAFGLSTSLRQLHLVAGLAAYTPLLVAGTLHAVVLRRAARQSSAPLATCAQPQAS